MAEAAGSSVLIAISNDVVSTFKTHYGKGPTSAKTYMVDDLVFVVMRGGLNEAEKFLLDSGEKDLVRAYRQSFENHMAQILSDKIEEHTGRKVLTFQSQVLFDPDLSVEIFVLDERAPDDAGVEATAVGQLADDGTGEVAGEAAAADPS
jgi:uncharacterized protein YbcI